MPIAHACVAPVTVPSPVPQTTLISLFLFFRHGARTTFGDLLWPEGTAWHCGHRIVEPPHRIPIIGHHRLPLGFSPDERHEYPPSCNRDQLLDEGFNQLERLGASYRRYLTGTIDLLPLRLNRSLIEVKSTYTDRTVGSAVGFMHGLYHPEADGELLDVTQVSFWEGQAAENLPGNPLLKKLVAESRRILRPMLEKFGWMDSDPFWIMALADVFLPRRCSNNSYDEVVTDEMYDRMLDDFSFLTCLSRSMVTEREWTPIWRGIDESLKRQLSGQSSVRLTVTAAHDTTLASILNGLGQCGFLNRPPYASHIAVEVWQADELFVRFVGNGQVIPVEGKNLTRLVELRKRFSQAERGL
jgi:hypothetical protein